MKLALHPFAFALVASALFLAACTAVESLEIGAGAADRSASVKLRFRSDPKRVTLPAGVPASWGETLFHAGKTVGPVAFMGEEVAK